MKIFKFTEYIKENIQDTPEEYVKILLMKLKAKIESIFEFEENKEKMTIKKALEKGKEKEEKGGMTLLDLGVRLESCEMSKYSAIFDSITLKFSDAEFLYSLYITVNLEDAVPKDKSKDFSIKDIKRCFIKFKKYDIDEFDLIGQITKTVDIESINEDFLVDLKIELDDMFSKSEETLEIET